MAAPVSNFEPTQIVAGDTWRWQKFWTDYPASTWTPTYYFRGAVGEFTVVGTATAGDTHDMIVASTTSATYAAGDYSWFARVTDGTTTVTVGTGRTTVLPDPASTGKGEDNRSHARIVLENIEAVLEGRASKDQEEYAIAGRSLKRTPIPDLITLRDRYKAEVRGEETADQISKGLGGRARILTRF